jgi:predicted DNA-binding transcriptional regulator YafY
MSLKKVREVTEAVVSVWDVNAKGWRSFRYDRVNSVNVVEEYKNEWFEGN